MVSRFTRRAVRRRSCRAAAATSSYVADNRSCVVLSCADETALMSCPAPFCPPGGSACCQPETATPIDCGGDHAFVHRRGQPPEGRHHGTWTRDRRGTSRRRDRQVSASSLKNNDAFQAWILDDILKVNKFTLKSGSGESEGESVPHPLEHAVGQWQRQARQTRSEAPCNLSRNMTAGSATAKAESCPPLLSSSAEKGESGGRSDSGHLCSFRQAVQDELRAWRRPSRRQTSSVSPAQDDALLHQERRLNKAIAEAGCCSRRKADELIFAGRVCVNGAVETHAGRRIGPNDSVSIDGRSLSCSQQKLYLMLHKPVQVVSTAADPQGRQTVLSLVAHDYPGVRLFPVGRLDYFSEGLILLTNDGRLAQRLMHPRHHLPKLYEVLVRNAVSQKALQCMRSGMRLAEGEELLPVEVTARSTASGCTLLRMILRQGVNRQIRRMCRDLGLTILRLRRVAIGPLQLGTLAPGHSRPLEESELAALRQAAGLR